MAQIINWESSKEYDNELSKIEHYLPEHHPEMMPFVGSHYKEAGILLLCESHYCSKYITEENETYLLNDWYKLPTPANFIDKGNFDTRYVLHNFLSNDRTKAHSMFSNPAKSIIEVLQLENISDSEAFNACAFMNYYQRPEVNTHESIKNTQDDNHYSYQTFSEVCRILKPKRIIFLSKKAYESFVKSNFDIGKVDSKLVSQVYHPTCSYWNRDGGKEKFDRIIRESLAFKDFNCYEVLSFEYIESLMPSTYVIKQQGSRFYIDKKIMRVYLDGNNVKEFAVHTKCKGLKYGVGYNVYHKTLWIWDYNKEQYISENEILKYQGLEELYNEFKEFVDRV